MSKTRGPKDTGVASLRAIKRDYEATLYYDSTSESSTNVIAVANLSPKLLDGRLVMRNVDAISRAEWPRELDCVPMLVRRVQIDLPRGDGEPGVYEDRVYVGKNVILAIVEWINEMRESLRSRHTRLARKAERGSYVHGTRELHDFCDAADEASMDLFGTGPVTRRRRAQIVTKFSDKASRAVQSRRVEGLETTADRIERALEEALVQAKNMQERDQMKIKCGVMEVDDTSASIQDLMVRSQTLRKMKKRMAEARRSRSAGPREPMDPGIGMDDDGADERYSGIRAGRGPRTNPLYNL